MPEYLSKEEIRKWRSSLERITLEEYAARLGKVIQEEKHDDSLVDSVMLRSLTSMSMEQYTPKTEKITTLALKSFSKEKEIKETKEVKSTEKKTTEMPKKPTAAKSTKQIKENKKEIEKQKKKKEEKQVKYSFKKTLTEREQLVFEHFLENRNTIVYARDLAKILDLPRDYVYKYIKNLRSKLNEDILQNADNGGYLLKI